MTYAISIYEVYVEEARIEIHPEFIEALEKVFWYSWEHHCDDSCWNTQDELDLKYGKYAWYWD